MRSDWFCVLGQDDQVDGALGLFAGLLWVAGCECTFCGTAGPPGEVVIVQSAGGCPGDRASLLSIRPVFADV
jgi:hypothetical protein